MQSTDVKIMLAERSGDGDNAGGRQTNNPVIDGAVNQLFPDISRMDRVSGKVELAKGFLAIDTEAAETHYGSHLILPKMSADPNVTVTGFLTGSHTDMLADARGYVEAYMARGPESPYLLYETQLSGQRQITCFSRSDARAPEVGDVFCLVGDDGQASEYAQFVRINDVSYVDEQFTLDGGCGTFSKRIWTLEITSTLQHTFTGPEITCLSAPARQSKLRTTTVADAAKFYGVSRLALAAGLGDQAIQVASIYSQIVPSTRTETPLLDLTTGTAVTTITSGGEEFEISGPAHSHEIEISVNNRGFSYVATMQPIPALGSVRIDYRSLGRWYSISDNSDDGAMGDGGAIGSALYSLDTGSVQLSLGSMPDVGSSIIITWASPVHYTDRAGSLAVSPPTIAQDLGEPVTPGSAVFTWTQGGQTRTATSDAAGNISGDGSGHIVYPTGEFWLRPSTLPDANTSLQIDYETDTAVTDIITGLSESGGLVSFTLGTTPIKPGSLRLKWEVWGRQAGQSKYYYLYAYRDGAWELSQIKETPKVGWGEVEYDIAQRDDGAGGLGPSGSVDYASGEVLLEVTPGVPYNAYGPDHGGWESGAGDMSKLEFRSGAVTAEYIENTGTPAAKTLIIDVPDPVIQFLPISTDALIPGTVRFTLGGVAFSDRSGQGVLYQNDGTVSGSIDYAARSATLTDHNGGSSVAINSLVSTYGDWYNDAFFYRIPGSPVQPGGTIVNATTLDGDLITETCDLSGFINSSQATGAVHQETGVVRIRYGQLVDETTLTPEQRAEDWYDPSNIDGDGAIWVPQYVFPNTVRTNTVTYKYLPLDAELLGLDPVRLPADGRVPIFRDADVIVILQDEETALPDPPVAGATYDLGQADIARLVIEDSAGAAVTTAHYSADRAVGAITMADPLDLSAYTGPFTAKWRIEDMALVTDVQIDGAIELFSPLQHAYDPAKATVATAMRFGNLVASYGEPWYQTTWTNEWADEPIGTVPLPRFNDAQFPIQIGNRGSIEGDLLIKFTGLSGFECYEKDIGYIAAGDTGSAFAPLNPTTGTPYFTLPAGGWGGGWAAGYCMRFPCAAGSAPFWLVRSTLPGLPTAENDQVCLEGRGDSD